MLKPNKTDKITGYRLYSVSQVPTSQKIIMLRDFNFQVPEIENALRNWSDEVLIEKLNLKIKERQNIILQEQKQIGNIKLAIESVEKQQLDIQYNIIVREIPAQNVISLRRKIPNHNCEAILCEEIFKYISNNHINMSNQNDNNIAIYHDDEYKDIDVDVEVCVLTKDRKECVKPFQLKKLETVESMACMMVRGGYSKLDSAYQSFIYWLEEHPQYEMCELSRQICYRDHTNEDNEEDYLTEIQIPVKQKND